MMGVKNKNNNSCWLMLLGTTLFLLSTLLCASTTTASAANVIVKAAYWSEDSIPLSSINSALFTHLFCAFAKLNSTTHLISVPSSFSQFTSAVRTKNPSVKTLLSIGGGAGQPVADAFASMAASPASRKAFIDSTINVARANSFDGLDIDYEIPATQSDMSNLGTLFSQWRAAVELESRASGRPRLLLTAAVRYTNTNYSPTSDPYPAGSIAANLDWINTMAYDFTAPVSWGDPHKTGPTAALQDPTTSVSGSSGVSAWIRAGVPATKIVLGIPFYGYAWTLADPSSHGYGSTATGPAITGDGAVTYNQVMDFVRNNPGAAKVYDPSRGANYCYQGNTWISYDDVQAVAAKVKYVTQNGLLGYFAWQISGDDAAFTLSTTAARSL